MADEEEDDLAALRNAVLASMKPKPKPPPSKEDDIDLEALRVAALRTKKTVLEPTNCHALPETPCMPVESVSAITRNVSPYRDQPPSGSPHRPNFHQHPPRHMHRQNFHRGRGGFRGRIQTGPRNQLGPRNQGQFSVKPQNLIVLTAEAEPVEEKPPKQEKPKGPARFSRLESDSDSDESDMDYGVTSAKDTRSSSSSSSSSEDEEDEPKPQKDSDSEIHSPDQENPPSPTQPSESKDLPPKKESVSPPPESPPVVGIASELVEADASRQTAGPIKPDYTRVPPPAPSPVPSPKRIPNPPSPDRMKRNVSPGPAAANVGKGSNPLAKQEPAAPQLKSQSSKAVSGRPSVENTAKSVQSATCSTPTLNSEQQKKEGTRQAEYRKANDVTEKRPKDIPKSGIDTKQSQTKLLEAESKLKGTTSVSHRKGIDTKANGRSSSRSLSRSSNSGSGSDSSSDTSGSESSSTSSSSMSDSDSDSDSGRRDKYKTIERGKDDIERERRLRVVREREKRHSGRRRSGDLETRRPSVGHDRSRRNYSSRQTESGRRSRPELSGRERRQYPGENRAQTKGISQEGRDQRGDSRRRPARKEEQNYERREEVRREPLRKEDPRREQLREKEPWRDEGKRERAAPRDEPQKRFTVSSEEPHKRAELKSEQMNVGKPHHELLRRDEPRRENDTRRAESRKRPAPERREKTEYSVRSGSVGKQSSNATGKRSDAQRPKLTLPESDLSDFSSDLDSPPQKIRSITKVVRGPSDYDDISTSHRVRDSRQSNKGTPSHSRSVDRRGGSEESSGSQKKTDNVKSSRIIIEENSGAKKKDARQIIRKLKGGRGTSPNTEKTESSHSPQINITFNKEPVIEGKSSKSRLSVHERLGMPVKQKASSDFESQEPSSEPKVMRRVITEDQSDARHRLKERQKESKDKEAGHEKEQHAESEQREKRRKSEKGSKKQKNYSIWSSHREVTVDDGVREEERSEDLLHVGIEQRLGSPPEDPSFSPESGVGDVRSRLSKIRKKPRLEDRLGVQSVVTTSQPTKDPPKRKQVKQEEEQQDRKGEGEEALTEKIKLIHVKNEAIKRRAMEVARDKQLFGYR